MARGGVAESVDARDLKSFGQKCLWGFKSPRPIRPDLTKAERISSRVGSNPVFLKVINPSPSLMRAHKN